MTFDVELISRYDLYTAVHDLEQVEAIERANIEKPIHVWVKIDIGMHRLGSCRKDEILKIKERLERCDKVRKPLGLISHLSVADTPAEDEYNKQEIKNFFDIAKYFDGDLSRKFCRYLSLATISHSMGSSWHYYVWHLSI